MKVRTSAGAHETQREWVYHKIRFALMSGRYQPGEKVTIAQLTGSLGVSMTPVREALRRLAAERALEMNPNRSVTVPKLSLDEVLAVRQIREQLEGFTARLAARRIEAPQLERLRRLGKELEKARAERAARRIMLLNEQFHFSLYEAAGVRVLTEIIATLWLQSAPTLNVLFRPENIGRYPLSEQNRHNRALLRALRARDGRAAERAVAAEIAVGSRVLRRLMPQTGRASI
jgi:DNA-binding GntR family transcriptional regulator